MTVSTEVDHNEYTGNGVTTSFPYTFRIFKKSDLVVQVVDLSENITELVLDTDYTVTGAGGYTGGNVILSTPLTNGYQISISRELPVTQETDLRNQGKFFAEVHEDAFDKLTMLIQQAISWLRLSLRKPSFIANYYDALNNYIRNLRDPSQPQDAATKNYVDSLSGTNLNRSLRIPEASISMLPDVAGRRNKTLSFDNYGAPLLLDPASSGLWGYVLIDSFQAGASITTRFEALHWQLPDGNGEYYRWDGALPKVVPVGSTPSSSGGIGNGAWLSVGDASLRKDLGVLTSSINIFEGSEKFLVTGSIGAIKTGGYHQVNDGGAALYINSGIGTPGETDNISYFVTNNGIKFNHAGDYNSAQCGIYDGLSENQSSKLIKLSELAYGNSQDRVVLNIDSLRADDDLINVDKIRMIGGGVLISSNSNNYYKQIFKEDDKLNVGKINISGDLSIFLNVASSGYKPKVVFVGDSLTMGGHRKADNYWWVKKLQYAINDIVSCDFYNRGIAGLSIEDFITKPNVDASYHAPYEQPWFNPSSPNTWADYVEELSPTLIFMAFGMNNPNAQDYQKILNARNRIASFSSKATVVWVTSPMRTTSLTAENSGVRFGTYPDNEYSNNSAISTRLIAERFGDAVIDVNRMSNIVMNGIDPLQSRMDRWAGLYRDSTYKFNDATKIVGGGSSDMSIILSDASPVITNEMFRDATVEFIMPAAISNFTAIKISFRKDNNSNSEVLFQVEPTEIGLYSLKDNSTQKIGSWSASPLGKTLRFEVIGSAARLFVNESIAIDGDVKEATFLSPISILGFSTTNTTLTNVVINATTIRDYAKQIPKLTPDQIFSVIYGDGGNGVNHPNTKGELEIYDAACQEFVNEIFKSSITSQSLTLKSGMTGSITVSNRNGVNILTIINMGGEATSSDDIASLPFGIVWPATTVSGLASKTDGTILPISVTVNGKVRTTKSVSTGDSYNGVIIW